MAVGSSSRFPIQQGVGGAVGGALRALGEPIPAGGVGSISLEPTLGLLGQPSSSPNPEPRCALRFPGTCGPLVQGQAWMAAAWG